MLPVAPALLRTRAFPRTQGVWLAAAVGVLLLFMLRLNALDVFPPFIDETVHLHTGERMWANGSPLEGVQLGRQFTMWAFALFRPFDSNPIWIGRAVNVLATLFSAACAMQIARQISGNRWGGAFAGLLYLLSSYHFFFDRLALADPFAGAFVMGSAAVALRLGRRAAWQDAAVVGLFLFGAVGAKINVLPFYGIPLAAALCLRPPGRTWGQNVRWAGIALGTGVGLLAAFALFARWRGLDFLTNSLSLAASGRGTVDDSVIYSPARVLNNIGATLGMFADDWLLPVLLVMLAACAVLAAVFNKRMAGLLHVRGGNAAYLLLVLLAPPLVWWINVPQESRFFLVPGVLLLVCGAVVFGTIARYGAGLLILFGLLGWGGLSFAPFREIAASNPAALPLPERDYGQYVGSDASGFGFDAIYDFLRPRLNGAEPARLIGVLANCQGLRYRRLPDLPITVECPQARPDGQDVAALTALLEATGENTYAVLERSPYLPDPDTIPGMRLLEVPVPPGRAPLVLVQVGL